MVVLCIKKERPSLASLMHVNKFCALSF